MAIVYGISEVVNWAVYKDLGSATAHATRAPAKGAIRAFGCKPLANDRDGGASRHCGVLQTYSPQVGLIL